MAPSASTRGAPNAVLQHLLKTTLDGGADPQSEQMQIAEKFGMTDVHGLTSIMPIDIDQIAIECDDGTTRAVLPSIRREFLAFGVYYRWMKSEGTLPVTNAEWQSTCTRENFLDFLPDAEETDRVLTATATARASASLGAVVTPSGITMVSHSAKDDFIRGAKRSVADYPKFNDRTKWNQSARTRTLRTS